MAKQPSTTIRDFKGRFASRRKRKVRVYVGREKAGSRYSRAVIKKWRAREIGPVWAPEPLPRERLEDWAGIKKRVRKKKPPKPVKYVEDFAEIVRVRFKAPETFGEMVERSGMLEAVAGFPAGQKYRLRIEGKTSDGERVQLPSRVFVLFGGVGRRMNMLLHHVIGVLGKELIEARGRGYNILGKNDQITYVLEVERTKRKKPKKRKKSRG